MNKRIILSGASGTGKSTVLNLFKEAGYPVVTEVVRTLIKEKGIVINEQAPDESQMLIFEGVMDSIRGNKFVADRGLADVLGYSEVGYTRGNISGNVFAKQQELALKFTHDNPDIIYIFFPVEFDIVADGIRSTDEVYRGQTSQAIENWVCSLSKNQYLTVHGTPEERFRQILDYVGVDLF